VGQHLEGDSTHIKAVDELVDGGFIAGEVFWCCHGCRRLAKLAVLGSACWQFKSIVYSYLLSVSHGGIPAKKHADFAPANRETESLAMIG
jgi:hypothetical protein